MIGTVHLRSFGAAALDEHPGNLSPLRPLEHTRRVAQASHLHQMEIGGRVTINNEKAVSMNGGGKKKSLDLGSRARVWFLESDRVEPQCVTR